MTATNATSPKPIIIIGAGMAGLTCANYLHRAGRAVLVLEADEAVGGRVRTDLTPDGFRLDRGFQVLLTKYPEVQRLLDYGALQLRAFRSGAVIRLENSRETTLQNPLQQPMAAFSALTAPIGTLPDKLRILSFVQKIQGQTSEQLLSQPSVDTLTYLRRYGWSEQIINRFFRPFFGGVFLDRELTTASNFFEFVFQQFVRGEAAVPALGMQQIPEQLAARLPAGTVRLNTKVEAIDGQIIRLQNGETLEAAAVVVAVDGEAAARLLPTSRQPVATAWRRTTCTYFAADHSPARADKLLRLNASPASLAHNVAFPSDVAPDYAPAGRTLISVSTHGSQTLTDDELTARLRPELTAWFGPEAAAWQHLSTYHIPHALPQYVAGQPAHQPLRLAENLFRCGDYTAYPSLNAAMASGREVAELLLSAHLSS
ncbi:Protoporphyrinogen oxidase [Hymenobacter daecheongensis DSM 21074]|uniref:Protoporphyrinogen oxidase n=1 Tax=Hymenobacter daecheongensis DSM 21074 TaxID=1121955 RepID=A0A1M6AWD7_9BACT|nr:NAD(P)/FAD-dependent oxidoreductase [Hymenobacter daecheongensis]SHI40772.1 Protoporphyrinogen oxidase [Hymenobacter daecheongensis DSM 21074]